VRAVQRAHQEAVLLPERAAAHRAVPRHARRRALRAAAELRPAVPAEAAVRVVCFVLFCLFLSRLLCSHTQQNTLFVAASATTCAAPSAIRARAPMRASARVRRACAARASGASTR